MLHCGLVSTLLNKLCSSVAALLYYLSCMYLLRACVIKCFNLSITGALQTVQLKY